jgi:hypothetical protein
LALAVTHPHHGMDIAATIEIGYELDPERIGCRD